MRFLLDEDVNPAVAAIAQGLGLDVVSVHEIARRGYDAFFQAGEPQVGLLIVPYSLPNHRPERIAHALKRWLESNRDPGPHFVDFLSG